MKIWRITLVTGVTGYVTAEDEEIARDTALQRFNVTDDSIEKVEALPSPDEA